MDIFDKFLKVYIPAGTVVVSMFSFFTAWVVVLDSRLHNLENQMFRLSSVVVSAQTSGSYCNIDLEKFLENYNEQP